MNDIYSIIELFFVIKSFQIHQHSLNDDAKTTYQNAPSCTFQATQEVSLDNIGSNYYFV